MEIEILLVDMEAVQKEVNNQMDEFNKESKDDYLTRIIDGEEKPRVFHPNIDIRQFANVHHVTFRMDDIITLYRQKNIWKGRPTAVVNIAGREYDWLYDEEKYETIRQYLNKKDNDNI